MATLLELLNDSSGAVCFFASPPLLCCWPLTMAQAAALLLVVSVWFALCQVWLFIDLH
jgi:hypothetical protein